MNGFLLIFSILLQPLSIHVAFVGHLNVGRHHNEAIVSNDLKPVPKFSAETIKQVENIVLYDNAPLNTGLSFKKKLELKIKKFSFLIKTSRNFKSQSEYIRISTTMLLFAY